MADLVQIIQSMLGQQTQGYPSQQFVGPPNPTAERQRIEGRVADNGSTTPTIDPVLALSLSSLMGRTAPAIASRATETGESVVNGGLQRLYQSLDYLRKGDKEAAVHAHNGVRQLIRENHGIIPQDVMSRLVDAWGRVSEKLYPYGG